MWYFKIKFTSTVVISRSDDWKLKETEILIYFFGGVEKWEWKDL